MTAPKSSRFSPHLVPVENLERLFVGRHDLLSTLAEDVVATARAGGARYELLVGPRGAGKSHLLALLAHRVREALGQEAVLVLLDEEEYVSSLPALLARTLGAMPAEEGLPEPMEQVRALQRDPSGDLSARAARMIAERLGERPLVLCLENLDQVFEALKIQGQKRLRAILQERGRWSVVATSRTADEPFTRRDRPFFGTFISHDLGGFEAEDCQQMLLQLSRVHERENLETCLRTPKGMGRVRAIHHLTGGTPRAMALIFPYLNEETLEDLVGAFYDLAEELTPYFQEQMARLPPGQRALLEQLAENWRPLSVSELAARCFVSTQSASSQLNRLRQDGLVRRAKLGRERFYELADPLHRISRAMKRPDRAMETLARFLVYWYDREEVEERLPTWWTRSAPTTYFASEGPPAWLVQRGLDEEPASTTSRSSYSPDRSWFHPFFWEEGPLRDAVHALPDDPEPFFRLATEERVLARKYLASQLRTDLLAALPEEPT